MKTVRFRRIFRCEEETVAAVADVLFPFEWEDTNEDGDEDDKPSSPREP